MRGNRGIVRSVRQMNKVAAVSGADMVSVHLVSLQGYVRQYGRLPRKAAKRALFSLRDQNTERDLLRH
jgi:hypothetical protein